MLTVLLCMLAFSGCIETSEKIVVDEEGMAMINFSAKADQDMAGEELAQMVWQFELMVPEINTKYERTTRTYSDAYSNYTIYEWTATEKIPVTDIKGVSWFDNNGTYEWRMDLEPLYDPTDINESDNEDLIMTVALTMPKEIDIANTPMVDGKDARWSVTKEMLTKNSSLRAITV